MRDISGRRANIGDVVAVSIIRDRAAFLCEGTIVRIMQSETTKGKVYKAYIKVEDSRSIWRFDYSFVILRKGADSGEVPTV